MTKDEIKTLIAEKISGQGNQVDIGGALDAILNAIIDAIPEGGGSGVPVLKMTIEGRLFNNLAFTGFAPGVPSRTVNFAVEGQTVQGVSLQNTTDVDDYIDAEPDGEGGFVATFLSQTATYFVEAVLDDNSIVSGVLFICAAE